MARPELPPHARVIEVKASSESSLSYHPPGSLPSAPTPGEPPTPGLPSTFKPAATAPTSLDELLSQVKAALNELPSKPRTEQDLSKSTAPLTAAAPIATLPPPPNAPGYQTPTTARSPAEASATPSPPDRSARVQLHLEDPDGAVDIEIMRDGRAVAVLISGTRDYLAEPQTLKAALQESLQEAGFQLEHFGASLSGRDPEEPTPEPQESLAGETRPGPSSGRPAERRPATDRLLDRFA